jgi:hypothetical protein
MSSPEYFPTVLVLLPVDPALAVRSYASNRFRITLQSSSAAGEEHNQSLLGPALDDRVRIDAPLCEGYLVDFADAW